MKDTQVKPVSLMPKSKAGIKKEKMPTKKVKEPKTPPSKAGKGKKNTVKKPEKKPKVKQEVKEPVPKRKRGRPRNDEKVQNQKKVKEQQKPPKNTENKSPGRKRKVASQNIEIKSEKETNHPPLKKQKLNDVNCNMNGNVKIPPVFQKPCVPKGESSATLEHTMTNNVNSNGTFHCKNNLECNLKKEKPSTSSVSKSVTFQSSPKNVLNCNSVPKPLKNTPNKSIKSILKTETIGNNHTKDNSEIPPKEIKVEKVNNVAPPMQSPLKHHPQRMASLDALAKMHVICIPDRKPAEHHSKSATSSVVTVCSEPFAHQKALTQCQERIHFDLKKEAKDFKGSIVHKQINYVKEKQQVFVSHSVEQSRTVSTKSPNESKKKKDNVSPKAASSVSTGKEHKQNQPSKALQAFPHNIEKKSKVPKDKNMDKKGSKTVTKVLKATKKSVKEKPATKGTIKKSKKLEQTKSEVKVKETIRMQKTCTYQSVTTVNSHGTTNSSVVPVSHVDLNYSKTKKTVVTDGECKNKINYSSGSLVNNSYCITSESPCSISHHSDCCKFHTHSSPQIIPVAHVQTCALGHGLNRTSDSSSSSPSHCDGNFAVHRFGHQQTVLYSPPSPEYGCCCSNSLVQNVHDSCVLRKGIMAYPHTHPHHTHHATNSVSPESLCTEYHSSGSSVDPSRHHAQHFNLSSSSYSRVNCCSCCEIHRENNQHHHQSTGSCLQYLSSPKNSASLVPCEQSPLDLSLASASSGSSVDSEHPLQPGHCSGPLCCAREVLLLRTSTPHGFQHSNFPQKKACCRCVKQISHETPSSEPAQIQCSSKNAVKSGQPHQPVDHVTLVTAPSVTKGSVIPPVPSTSGINKNASRVATENLVPTKREKSASPKQSVKVLVPKKKQFAHGWSWKGKPRERLIALTNDSTPCPRLCYPSVEHKEGDVIKEKDCVLLRSGPKDTDLPYVAKVSAFWENPEDGEMMMSLLWYYRPEHTDQGRKPGQMEDEVFASRHKDVNSIACIEDKCYVLTYNEYCRNRGIVIMDDDIISLSSLLVPDLPDGYPRKTRLPNDLVANDIVFFCRHVYDFRQRRILKNPS
ncbi:UNVERIFIED_CONTAM: Bahd1 [Trichonephila clavipes]